MRVRYPDGSEKSINWNDLEKISMLVTGDAPKMPDVWLMLAGKGNTVLLPAGFKGYDLVYDRVSALPGFDFASVVKALSTVSEKDLEYQLWNNEAEKGSPPPDTEAGPQKK